MSSPAKQPCAPPLNLVPNGTAGSAFPPPLDESIIPIASTNPGYGDLVASLLDDAADPADGFDQAVADTSAAIDAWDAALAAQDADLDAILTLLAAADPSPADSSLADYSNSFDAGNALVAGAQGLSVPDIGQLNTLWVSAGTTVPTPPSGTGVQVPGQITVGDPPFTYLLKTTLVGVGGGGASHVQLTHPGSVITSATLQSAGPIYEKVPGGGISPVPSQDVVVAVSIDPVAAGLAQAAVLIYAGALIPFPRGVAINVQPKPAGG